MQTLQLRFQDLKELLSALSTQLNQVLTLDDVERAQRDGGANRVTGPGVIMLPDVRKHHLRAKIVESSFPDVVAVDDGAVEEIAARKALADDHDIRAHTVQLHAEPVPCFRKRYNFVCDYKNTIFLADFFREREEVAVHVDCATVALDRLKDKGGNGLGTFMQNTLL